MDLITYVKDLNELVAEAIAVQETDNPLAQYFTIDEGNTGVTFNVPKVPVVFSNNNETLSLVRGVPRSVIEQSTSIEVLGECINGEYVFDSLEKQAIYESVYDTKPRMIDDGDGGTFEYTPPYKIGVFS